MGYAPTPDNLSPAEARIWRMTQDAAAAEHNYKIAAKKAAKEDRPAPPKPTNRLSAYERAQQARLKRARQVKLKSQRRSDGSHYERNK